MTLSTYCHIWIFNLNPYINITNWWFEPPEKYESQIGSSSQLFGKIQFMFQITNQ